MHGARHSSSSATTMAAGNVQRGDARLEGGAQVVPPQCRSGLRRTAHRRGRYRVAYRCLRLELTSCLQKMSRILMDPFRQLNATVFQIEEVTAVHYRIDGSCRTFWGRCNASVTSWNGRTHRRASASALNSVRRMGQDEPEELDRDALAGGGQRAEGTTRGWSQRDSQPRRLIVPHAEATEIAMDEQYRCA